MPRARIKSLLKFALLLVFVGAAIGFFYYTELGRSLEGDIHALLESTPPAAARMLYVAVYIVGSVVLFPGTILSFIGAVLFGVWEGTLYTWIGATLGASLAFPVARFLGRDFVNHLLGGKLAALDQRLREHGMMSLLVIRLVPLFPFNGVNFGCGLTNIRFRDYFFATALGIVPGTFVYQYLFATLGKKVLDGDYSWRDLIKLEVLAPIALFIVFVVASAWLGRWLRGKATSDGEGSMPR